MVLKSIELIGFKSFAKKTELTFNVPVTAIVGPNGSGKSNVVEAIRFVLGEQSIKSLRGKGGSDMIFKGSKLLSPMSRAKVSIVFDNKEKLFRIDKNSESKLSVDFDEVVISREVFSDGSNEYRINNTVVRLKDVLEILAGVNIGSSGHHIISQGEADRLLTANSRDRRGMVEDALGLRVYQMRIKESERKLEKTISNMKEVSAIRREIAPHIMFLKKQAEKIEKAQALRVEVISLYHKYFFEEQYSIINDEKKFSIELSDIKNEIQILKYSLDNVDIELNNKTVYKESWLNEIQNKQNSLNVLKNEIIKKIGHIEGAIEMTISSLERLSRKNEIKIPTVSFSHVSNFIDSIKENLILLKQTEDSQLKISIIEKVEVLMASFINQHGTQNNNSVSSDDILELQNQQNTLKDSLNNILNEKTDIDNKIQSINEEYNTYILEKNKNETDLRESERTYYENKRLYDSLVSKQDMILFRMGEISKRKNKLDEEKQEALVLIGHESVGISDEFTHDDNWSDVLQENLRRQIERIKIKIEDIGGGGGSDILLEYEEKVQRDQFLANELIDLENAINELRSLIQDLRDTIDREFKIGVEKINKQFNEFFSLMFGGGGAFLSIVVEHKRPSKDEDEEIPTGEVGDFQFERGIEINVSLPHKKVKELGMLSGGERSLTSIALLFAMSQVNPPPFLVLDETDAALDEANSRRYGDMIENLSRYSQLIVVTHNRETMSRANVLYGVTIGSDGGSKLLSIKLEEAVSVAK